MLGLKGFLQYPQSKESGEGRGAGADKGGEGSADVADTKVVENVGKEGEASGKQGGAEDGGPSSGVD